MSGIPEDVATAYRISHNLDEALSWILLMKGEGIAINTGKVDGVATEIFRLKNRFGCSRGEDHKFELLMFDLDDLVNGRVVLDGREYVLDDVFYLKWGR
jgi:hypothetical protein